MTMMIIFTILFIILTVADLFAYFATNRRLDARVMEIQRRLDNQRDWVSLIDSKTTGLDGDRWELAEVRTLVDKLQRDGNLMAEHLGIEYYTEPASSTPETRYIRKNQTNESEEMMVGHDRAVSKCKHCGKSPLLWNSGCSYIHRCPECGRTSKPRLTIQQSQEEWEDSNG